MDSTTPTPPWYAAGLAFECQQCGRCCAGPTEGYVWVTEKDIAAIAAHLQLDEKEFRRKYVRKVGRRFSLTEQSRSNDCVFLTVADRGDRRCAIYEVRPSQCRTWPFWPSNLASADAWAEAQLRCPGINRGRLHSCEEIQAKCNATRE